MSEENMNQEQQVETTPEPSFNNEKKPKSNKMIIIVSTVVSLIIIAVVVAFFVISNQTGKIAKDMETYLNDALKEARDADEYITEYDPFVCTGSMSIVCKSKLIKIEDGNLDLDVKNIEYVIKPGLTNATVSSSGDYSATIKEYDDVVVGTINMNLKCTDDIELVSDKGYLINNVSCNNSIGNIKNKLNTVVYLRSEEFKVGSLEKLVRNYQERDDFTSSLEEDLQYAVTEFKNNLKGKNLAQDIVDIINQFDSNKKTLEELKEEFNEAKELLTMFSSSSDSAEDKLAKDGIQVVDNVLNNNHNSVDMEMTFKKDKDMEDLFFIGFSGKLYDFSFSSK